MKNFLTPGYERALVASDLRHGGATFAELHGIQHGRDCDRYRPPLNPAPPPIPSLARLLFWALTYAFGLAGLVAGVVALAFAL